MSDHASWYERHLLPYLIDFACGLKPVRRQELIEVVAAAVEKGAGP